MANYQGLNPFSRPDNQLYKIWELYVRTLREDPRLSAGVKTWQTWDGKDESYLPWTPDLCPILKITPTVGQWKWADELRHDGLIVLEFDLGISSRNVLYLWDFWECIHRALFPPDNDLLNQSLALGGIQKTSQGPALNPELFANATCLGATGQIALNCWINS